jgi:hypothetical protein
VKSTLLKLLHVAPEYIVVVGNPQDMGIDEFELRMPVPGYIAAKSLQIYRSAANRNKEI